ncbi:MAG: TetR/AcrR family transcriptional regulator [Nannocystaceae bacterium]
MSGATPAKDARQLRTRAKLLRALLSLLEQQPFEAISVRAIASTAGIGYATFFRHYANKEALLDDLAADEIAELLRRAMPVMATEDSLRACVALIDYITRRKALWRALLTGGAAPILRARFIDHARAIAADFPGPRPTDDCPVDLRTTFATSATLEIITWWLGQDDDSFTTERIAAIVNRLAVAPIVGEI